MQLAWCSKAGYNKAEQEIHEGAPDGEKKLLKPSALAFMNPQR